MHRYSGRAGKEAGKEVKLRPGMTAHIIETCICRWWRAFKGLRSKERGWHDQTYHLERLSWKNDWADVWEDFGKLKWGIRWMRRGNVWRGLSQEDLEDWLRWFGWGERQGVEDREKEQPAAWKCVTGSSLKKMMLKTGKMWGLGAGWKGGLRRHKIWILFRGSWVWSTSRASRYRYCQLLWGVLEKFIWGFAEVG